MADVQEMLKELLISSLEGAGKSTNGASESEDSGGSHGGRNLAAGVGVGAAALAPVAFKGLGKLAREAGMKGVGDLVKSPGKAVQGLGGELGSNLGDKVSDKVDEAGGPSGILSDAVKGALPFGGGGGGDKGGGLGVGKGRRMPVQQSVDIGAPLETVYNQWTQYEDWPKFMHRVVNVSQDDENKVHFTVKIWTRTREFTAEIETQRPDERVKWTVSEGMNHAGVVTFHELGPHLTRVLLSIDVQPGGMIEKMARGMRHVKRAARGDLHRFKAFIEMAEQETGAWRGRIEDGEVVEEHDPSYDEGREYSDPDEVLDRADEDEDKDDADQDDADQDDGQEEEEQPRAQRRRRQPSTNGHDPSGSGRRTSAASRSSSSRAASGSSARGRSGGSGSSPRSSSRSSGSTAAKKSSRSSGSSGAKKSSRSSGSTAAKKSSRSTGSTTAKKSARSGGTSGGSGRTRSGSSQRASSGSSSGRSSRSRGDN